MFTQPDDIGEAKMEVERERNRAATDASKSDGD